MLIQLNIQNLVLIDKAEIVFEKGLNVITGETGAGKSAILSAIRLLTGERSEAQWVGKHGDFAIVEAVLKNGPKGEQLYIRREIHLSGRNRCFANDEQISLGELRRIVGSSIELVDGSSTKTLYAPEEQRRILDLFGDTLDEAKEFEHSFLEEKEIQKELEILSQAEETRDRDLAWAEGDLLFLDEINWQKGEEESLLEEHRRVAQFQHLSEKIHALSLLLENPSIKQSLSALKKCVEIDPKLSPLLTQFQNASCEIEDVQTEILSYQARMETNPKKLSLLEERIGKIDQIKRRFGKTWELVQEKKKSLVHRIEELQNLETKRLALKSSLEKKQKYNRDAAKNLSEKRKMAANLLSKVIREELQTLNLPRAQFTIFIEEQEMHSYGYDAISYLFSANAGQSPIPIEQCASGGELARLLFAIKTTFVHKEKTNCLIFDEIDGNVGGQTATILGEKLKAIAQERQIICITHFMQVARFAMTHFAVAKREKEGKTVSQITKLNEQTKLQEYERMLGVLSKDCKKNSQPLTSLQGS